jgi:vitamin B12 transporter
MKRLPLAALVALALPDAGAQMANPATLQALEPFVVTATRSLNLEATLRETTLISRQDLDESGSRSLADVLLARAGVELRATGGPGQPVGLFMRGTGTAQTLVLVDGMRVGSATVGTTSIENLPLEMIERIEVVKGPMSSLYGSEAIGGVVQVFTRGKDVPHLHAVAGGGSDREGRLAAGVTGVDASTSFSVAAGARTVDAPSATNERSFCFDADRDPYENAWGEAKVSHRLWQGETLAFNSFVSRGKTRFDGCPDASGQRHDDLNDQTILGMGVSSSSRFTRDWTSRLAYAHGRDEITTTGAYPARFETRQDQLSWVNEFAAANGTLLAGLEGLRQEVLSDQPFAKDRRTISSAFFGLNQSWHGQRVEMSGRIDRDDQFGERETGSVSYGTAWAGIAWLSGTYGRGFRAPTFYDLYGPPSGFYQPNPELRPERSKSYEVAARSQAGREVQWRVTWFDNQLEDLIAYDPASTMQRNIARARIRGLEASAQATWLGVRWRGLVTYQRPRDEDSGYRLQGRSELFGSLEGTYTAGLWTLGGTLVASGDRFDSTNEAPASRLPGYAVVDMRVRYAFDKRWSAELSVGNVFDKRYETAVGYDATRRSALLSLRFEAF